MTISKRSPERRSPRLSHAPIARETVNIVVVSLSLFIALEFGAFIAERLNATTPWAYMACLAAPIVLVAAMFWFIGRLL